MKLHNPQLLSDFLPATTSSFPSSLVSSDYSFLALRVLSICPLRTGVRPLPATSSARISGRKLQGRKKPCFVRASFFYSVHSSMLPSSPASPPLLPLAPVLSSTPDFYISRRLPTRSTLALFKPKSILSLPS